MSTPEDQLRALLAANAKLRVPKAPIDPTAASADSLDAAARLFALGLKVRPDDPERAGVIYNNQDGTYSNSIATDQRNDSFALAAQPSAAHRLAALFHTHPGTDPEGRVFSPQDIQVANQLKIPSYVLFAADGTVRSYTPGVTKTQSAPRSLRAPLGSSISYGDPVDLAAIQARLQLLQQKAQQAQQTAATMAPPTDPQQ